MADKPAQWLARPLPDRFWGTTAAGVEGWRPCAGGGGSVVLGCIVTLCGGWTPPATGADTVEVPVPYDPADGVSPVAWIIRRITLRVQIAGGSPAVTIEKSTVAGAFVATSVGTLTMGAGNYEVSATAGLGAVNSGDKLRFNPTVLGTAEAWTITVEMGV